jgi:hypothetical protein
MAKQGEAYIRIRADLAPFSKDLDKGIKQITDRFEATLNRRVGKTLGQDMGGGVREGLTESAKGIGRDLDKELGPGPSRERGRRSGRSLATGIGDGLSNLGPVRRALSQLTSALEDGFSALPAEVKAVVGGAIVAAIIPAVSLLTAAVGGAVVSGLAVLGTALASQFTEVQERFDTFVDQTREQLVRTAAPFEAAVLNAIDVFRGELLGLDDDFRMLFERSAVFVEPLARGLADAVSEVVKGLNEGLAGSQAGNLAFQLEEGFRRIGDAVGQAFDAILSNPDLDEGLESLFNIVAGGIVVLGEFASFTLSAMAALKDIGDVALEVGDALHDVVRLLDAISDPTEIGNAGQIWQDLINGADDSDEALKTLIHTRQRFQRDTQGTIVLTKEQTKEIEEQRKAVEALNKALDDQLELANDLISTQINYADSLADTVEGLKKHGADLRLNTEIGRENRRNIQDTINDLKAEVKARVEAGELSNEAAQKYYDQEIARLREEFRQRGGNLKQFDQIFAALIKLQGAKPVPNLLGPMAIGLQNTFRLIANVQIALAALKNATPPKAPPPPTGITGAGSGQQKYADGGFITQPTVALMGEGYKDEVVLPLTQPNRSLQLLARSPLAGVLGTPPIVNVYVGNEKLESTMYQVAASSSRASARTLSQVPRMV